MKLISISTFVGPSIYAQHPVIHFALDDLAPQVGPDAERQLPAGLSSRLPGLLDPASQRSAPGHVDRLSGQKSLPINHLFEHVCVELQNLAGANLACTQCSGVEHIGPREAVVAYEEAEVCIEAARAACDLLACGEPQDLDCAARIDALLVFAERKMLPVQDRALIETAKALDIPAMRLVGRIVTLGQGRFQQRLSATKTTHTSVVSNDLAANKDYARRILRDLGLPVPACERVYRRRQAVEAARRIGYPVVVKPNNGHMGAGVSVGMRNRREVNEAFRRARQFGRSVLVEEMIEGADYRMLVIDGKLCAAAKRVPGHVVGDGTLTIEELVAEVNSDPRRGTGPTHSWTRIKIDDQADRLIAELGYTRQSIPPEGEVVYLRRNANTSDGGTAVDVTDDVHPDNRDIAVRTAKIIGLDIAGVDFLTRDISTSMWENGGKVIEVNSRPGVRKHMWPAEGKPRDVTTPIIDMLFPAGRPGRIPIVAIVGTGSTDTAAQMLAHILTLGGHHVGLASNHHVFSAGRATDNTPLTAPAAARRVLLDPSVDVAVLQITLDDVLRHGLGCDAFDVAAIVNSRSSADANAPEPAALDAIRLIARTTRDVLLVSDADDCALDIENSFSGSTLYCVTMSDEGREAADPAWRNAQPVVLEERSITIYDQNRRRARIPMAELTQRLPEVDADQLVRSALLASVIAHSLGKAPRDIYRNLRSFNPAPCRAK